ncbi:dehydrogenase FAD flavoprotein GMC oxidoreductase [Mycobacterium tuberculosis]|nr:dehydrogenase FAD flavoprotein GMC oxidoreductase [Mycobacterium tuberculosis]
MDTQSDYVVVGTGSAGAVVASRLSTDPATTVVALEAGPRDKNRFIGVPAAFSKLFRSEIDWDYLTEPQPELDGREIYWPRGKVLGGSSSMNAMMWVLDSHQTTMSGPREPVRGGRTPTCSATFAASRTSPLPGTLSAVTTAE